MKIKLSFTVIVIVFLFLVVSLSHSDVSSQTNYTYTVSPTGWVCGNMPNGGGIAKVKGTPNGSSVQLDVRTCNDSPFQYGGQAYVLVDEMRNYQYQRSPSGYVCGSDGVVELSLSPRTSGRDIKVTVRKCNGEPFLSGGEMELLVNGVAEWDENYSTGDTTIEFYIDPVQEGLTLENTYQAKLYPSNNANVTFFTGEVEAWEVYDYSLYKWGPINYSAGQSNFLIKKSLKLFKNEKSCIIVVITKPFIQKECNHEHDPYQFNPRAI